MIPSFWAILVYQVLAFIGIDAVAQIVTYIAYKRQDLDTKLMYSQKPLDMIYNYHRFKKTTFQKSIIIFFAVFALLLGFIPTVLTKLHRSVYVYSDLVQVPLQQSDTSWIAADMPVINNILPFLQNNNGSATVKEILTTYLSNTLQQNTTENPTGLWFNTNPQPSNKYFNDQVGGMYGFFTTDPTYLAFGFRPADSLLPTSDSLKGCADDPALYVPNLETIAGFQVSGARTYEYVCYPMYDRTASIYRRNATQNKINVLSAKDNIYRTAQLSPGVSARGTFGVGLLNHNATHMSMGIKKMASITMYNYNASITPPTDCSSTGKTENATISFKDLPNDRILCHLLITLPSLQNYTSMRMFQATKKYYDDRNHAMNSVYTVVNGGTYEPGQAVMVDLNMFAVYTIEGQLGDDKEHLLAFEEIEFGSEIYRENNTFEGTLDNNNLEYILDRLDTTVLDEQTIDTLVAIASMRARWSNQDLSDFNKITAKVVGAIETSTGWIVGVCVLFVVFLIPQFIRLLIRHNPYYSQDFRTILISILENKDVDSFTTDSEPKNIALVFTQPTKEGNLDAELTINGKSIKVQSNNESSQKRIESYMQ